MKKWKTLVSVMCGFLITTVAFQNCENQFEASSLHTPSDTSALNRLGFGDGNIISKPLPYKQWIYPKYSLLPLTEAGTDHESMPTKRRTHITEKFHPPVAFFKSKALNVYNPNVIQVPDARYPFRMYFFGWAKEACNAHLPYHPEHNQNPRKNENWCDSIFLARAQSLTGPWQVIEEDLVFRNNLDSPERWKPILYSNGRDKMWDYHHTGDPSVIYVNGIYFMAYSVTGHDLDERGEFDPQDYDDDFQSIAGAYSHDGISWIKLAQPLLVSPKEAGFSTKHTDLVHRTNVSIHRPNLMYDEGKFKLWFDYWLQGFPAMGYAELSGDPNLTTFASNKWVIKQGDDKPAIRNWINPTVIKTSEGYFSYSDALLSIEGDNEGWKPRRLHEAYSADGLTWTINGHIPHLPNCMGHAPETILLNNEIHLLYHCVGDSPDKDTMFVRRRKDLSPDITKPPVPPPPVCTPRSKQACTIANGSGERTCNAKGSAYGACVAVSCNKNYNLTNNTCVKRNCKTPEATAYISTSLTYFKDAQNIALVSAIAKNCYNQTDQALKVLNQTDWECTKTDATVNTVKTCVKQIEDTLKQCQVPDSIKSYLRTAQVYLEGAVKIPKVKAQAESCLKDLKTHLPEIEKQKWPCPYAQSTFEHIATCIEKVIKPNLGQN